MSSIRRETRKRMIVSSVEGCVATRRNTETNLLVGANLSLCLFPSFAYWHTVARVLSYSHFLFCTLVLFRACARVTTFAIVITSPLKPTFFFKQYAATVSPNIDRSSCVHVIELERTQNLVLRYKCQIIRYLSRRVVDNDNAIYGKEKNKRNSLGFSLVCTIYKLATVINKCERRLKRVDGLNSQWSRRVPTYSTAFVRLLTNHRYDSADADSDTDTDVPTPTPTPTRPLTLHITGETLARIEINFRQQQGEIDRWKKKKKR